MSDIKETETYYAVYVHGANRAIAYFVYEESALGWARECHAYNFHIIPTELPVIYPFTDEQLENAKKKAKEFTDKLNKEVT